MTIGRRWVTGTKLNGPTRCRVLFDVFFDRSALGNYAFIEESLAKIEQVQREDIHICHSVQKVLLPSAYDVGRYTPKLEHGMYAFHRWLGAGFSNVLEVDDP